MNADEFLETLKDPHLWIEKSVSLRQSANQLWEQFFRCALRGITNDQTPESEQELQEAFAYLSVAKMLYGLSIETALKGYLIAADPANTSIQLQMDGGGNVVQAELRQLGVPVSQGHNLVQLAEKAGGFTQQSVTTDPVLLRDVLKHLTDCITWKSKYPVPKKSGNEFVPDPNVPLVVFQHYIRDVIDPLLDAYHPHVNSHAASVKELDRMYAIVQEERGRRGSR